MLHCCSSSPHQSIYSSIAGYTVVSASLLSFAYIFRRQNQPNTSQDTKFGVIHPKSHRPLTISSWQYWFIYSLPSDHSVFSMSLPSLSCLSFGDKQPHIRPSTTKDMAHLHLHALRPQVVGTSEDLWCHSDYTRCMWRPTVYIVYTLCLMRPCWLPSVHGFLPCDWDIRLATMKDTSSSPFLTYGTIHYYITLSARIVLWSMWIR